jgi:uncharacterized cupredoxin-like copper-binding protein
MRSRRGFAALATIFALALLAAACGGDEDGGGNEANATLSDFKIVLDKSSGSPGDETFHITNEGPSAHEFVVFNTDLAEDQLPTTEENGVPIVDEEGSTDLELVDEAEDIEPDTSTDLTVNLQAGSYVIICNVPGHYSQGMHTSFSVS